MVTREHIQALREEIQSLYDQGNDTLIATMRNGEKQTLRLFVGASSGSLCYFGQGMRRRGYFISNILMDIESVEVKGKKKKAVSSPLDEYMDNLKKFKKIFTVDLHQNLWSEIREGYNNLDLEDFKNFVEAGNFNDQYGNHFYEALREYSSLHNLHVITENHYKTTTIVSNKPKDAKYDYQYNLCINNIKKHLDNKEDFHYFWRGGYDVSVSGKLCEDGKYRAWLSLEYRNCGNGHYYLLINENKAVFTEDD